MPICTSDTLTWLISSEVLMIEHWYLACMIFMTSPFIWHHAVTLILTLTYFKVRVVAGRGPQFSEFACSCWFENKVAALASDWLKHFRLLLCCNCRTEFDKTWWTQSLCSSGRSKKWLSWPLRSYHQGQGHECTYCELLYFRQYQFSSVRKFVIWGLPEHSLSPGDLSYELFMLNWCNKLTDVITSLAYIIINNEQNVGHTNM